MTTLEPMVLSLTALPMILIAGAFAFSPRTRRGLLFGCTVAIDFADTPKARGMIRGFRLGLTVVTLICLALAGVAISEDLPWLLTAVVPAQLIGIFVLWVAQRRRVAPYEIVVPVERSARLAAPAKSPVLWFALMALTFVPLAASWSYLRAHWTQIPDRFAIHWGLNGAANGLAARDLRDVAFPLVMGALVLALMFGIALLMRFAPGVDRERSMAILLPSLTGIAWILSAEFCAISLVPLMGNPGQSTVLWMTLGAIAGIAAVVVWMVYRLRTTLGQDHYDGTSDSAWRAAGFLYYNPADAAILVPKRTGLGWTLNFGQPLSWAVMVAILGFLALTIFFSKGMR
jgi:uncharacterized membrane protein